MAYIYHIVTPKGTYVGQAKGKYFEPQWPSMSLRGNLTKCRLWWHFNNAYVKGSQANWNEDDETDTRAEHEVANVLRCYSPGQVQVRVFLDSEDYGIKEDVYKFFIKTWLPNATRVAKEDEADLNWKKLKDMLTKIKKDNFSSDDSRKRYVNDTVKKRELSKAEKLDLAEIIHIYYLVKDGQKLLNTQMGGQMTGWFPIMETKLKINTKEKVLYREMTPQHACKTMDIYLQSTHEIVKQITDSLNNTTKQVFSNQNFWIPVIDYIIDDPKATLFQHIIDGSERSVVVRDLSKLVDDKIQPIKQEFVKIVNEQVSNILQSNNIENIDIADFFDDKKFGVINWDEILDWLTGYVYNIVQKQVDNAIQNVKLDILKQYKDELKRVKNLYKSDKDKLEAEIKRVKSERNANNKDVARKVQEHFKTSQSSNLNKWKNMNFYRNGVFQVGTMINLSKLNHVLKKSSKRKTWQDVLKEKGINLSSHIIDSRCLKAYSMILFYDFYTNAVQSIQNFKVDIISFSGDRKKGDFVQYAKLNYGHDPESYLNRKILKQYRNGGMKDTAWIRKYWHQAFTSMFYLAEQKRISDSHVFIQDTENKSKRTDTTNAVRVIHATPYLTTPNPVYIVHDFPKNVWAAMQKSQIHSIDSLQYY